MFIRALALVFCIFLSPLTVNANVNQQSLPSLSVLATAQELVENMLDRSDGSEYVVESLTRLPDNILLPAGFIEMQPQLVGKLRYGVPIQVRVSVKVNSMPQMNLITLWRIKKVADVVVTLRDLPTRTTITAADIAFERREIINIDEAIFDESSIIGLETRRPITARTILSKSMFGKPQLIKTGDNITIISTSGTVVVKVNGQALQGGAVGDIIRVRNLSSGKGLLGRVVDENTVIITNVTR